jgi:hypothetical protein
VELDRNLSNNYLERKYVVTLDSADQALIGEAYAWNVAEAKLAGTNDIEERLNEDFVLLGIIPREEHSEDHKAYVNGEDLTELQEVLAGYQKVIDIRDRPVLSRTEHNIAWPDFRAANMVNLITGQLVYLEMNTKQSPASQMRTALPPLLLGV